ncbi:MAG: hypothetical protein HY560_05520, partial [Gemmatimonadetes bacterium]|nr:hypothetical protein [Gemmatimonadota bacterium]
GVRVPAADAARKVIEEIGGNTGGEYRTGALGSYNALAMPSRFVLERDDWAIAAALKVATATPSAESVTHFARALGAARSGDVATAKQESAVLEKMIADLTAAKTWASSTVMTGRSGVFMTALGLG